MREHCKGIGVSAKPRRKQTADGRNQGVAAQSTDERGDGEGGSCSEQWKWVLSEEINAQTCFKRIPQLLWRTGRSPLERALHAVVGTDGAGTRVITGWCTVRGFWN